LAAPAVLLAATVAFFGLPGLGGEAVDLWFQSLFWDGQGWLVPHKHPVGMVLAYRGPKALIILAAVVLIGVALFRPRRRMRALYLLACFALVPVVCTQLRAVSHMATPLDLKLYGGAHEHLLLFQPKPPGYPCHAFPAGHASGGFALMAVLLDPLRTTLARARPRVGGGRLGWVSIRSPAASTSSRTPSPRG